MGQRPGADPQAQCSCPITARDQGLTWLCVSRKIKKGALGFSISRKDICLLQGCLIARVKLKRQSILPHNVAEDSYPLLRTSNTSPHICRARSELVLISWLWLCMSSLAALLGAGIFPWKILLWNWLPHVHGARGPFVSLFSSLKPTQNVSLPSFRVTLGFRNVSCFFLFLLEISALNQRGKSQSGAHKIY